jgi:hypothetical protein
LEPGSVIALNASDRKVLQDLSERGGVISISKDDRTLLQELSQRSAPLADELRRVDASVRAVAEESAKLTAVVEKLKPGTGPAGEGTAPPSNAALETAISRLSTDVGRLADALAKWKPQPGTNRIEVYSKGEGSGTPQVDLNDLNRTLVAIRDALSVRGKAEADSRNAAQMLSRTIEELQSLNKQLERLNSNVQLTLPNRNVHGVGAEGGAR